MSKFILTIIIILHISFQVFVKGSPVDVTGVDHGDIPEDSDENEDTNRDEDDSDEYDEDDLQDALDNPEERGNLLEGDMILPPKALNGLIDERFRWPQAIVPFVIDFKFRRSERKIIYVGMKDITTRTCVDLIERTTETDYVFVKRGDRTAGCSSTVGRSGGVQTLNLNPQCLRKVGTVTHEFLHALGLRHEQSRSDRDNHLDIEWDNIKEEFKSNFKKYPDDEVDPFGTPYDYGSVMHYSAYGFAKDGTQPTLVPKTAGVTIGQRIRMSDYDALKINRMYNCEIDGTSDGGSLGEDDE